MNHAMNFGAARSQRGAAALIVTLMLFLALALAAFALNRHLVFAQRASANQARATQAFEAAEAGLEWAQALLNNTQRIGADCMPSEESTTESFRDRVLSIDRSTGIVASSSAQPACVRGANGWSCDCPQDGPGSRANTADSTPTPGFALRFESTGRPGTVHVFANGCSHTTLACNATSLNAGDAVARVETTLALFGGLRTPPVTAVTTRDAASQTPAEFFAAYFGIDKARWQGQSVVAKMACSADCGAAIGDAIAAGSALIWVDTDLTISGPVALGTAGHPVVIVANGTVRLNGSVAIVGAVYATSIVVDGIGPLVQGALMSESPTAAADVRFDPDVLAALARQIGSFVRVSGSWRDF